eukprot:CAMPEP_0194663860 /NCGR_PEP_ID=MMETSP0295-20121207/1106_1 /TAXON_ID=39354 /ORGANISM="Heterosigma akashiwo, Strain CCMP2393" /LENGTH=149 /DNA_ID=CAMNT_0039545469 /DNA_START=333 /DNA_END=785 /DNA_ORIENTATION=+
MGKQEGPIPPYPPRTGDHNGVPPRNRVFQGRPGGQTAWNEGSLKQNFGSRVQNLDGISVGSNRESYARGVIGGGEQSSMVGDQFSAPESPELGEATPNLGSVIGGGIYFGSTLMTFLSLLFLKSKPASLSAMTWKLGVELEVEVCVSQL